MTTRPQFQKPLYDHRLRELVSETGDITVALDFGVPRSTATGWLTSRYSPVISHELFDLTSEIIISGTSVLSSALYQWVRVRDWSR